MTSTEFNKQYPASPAINVAKPEIEYLEVPSPEEIAAEVERIEFERNLWARKRYVAFANYDVDTLIDDEPGHIVPDHEPVEEFL